MYISRITPLQVHNIHLENATHAANETPKTNVSDSLHQQNKYIVIFQTPLVMMIILCWQLTVYGLIEKYESCAGRLRKTQIQRRILSLKSVLPINFSSEVHTSIYYICMRTYTCSSVHAHAHAHKLSVCHSFTKFKHEHYDVTFLKAEKNENRQKQKKQ